MTTRFINGQVIDETDFTQSSSGVDDAGKAVVLSDLDGKIDRSMIRGGVFGGNGSDDALTISSGTTNIDLGGAQVFVKNYTSISITGTGKLTFTNPHANGTVIILKSQGDVTLTSSATPNIDLRDLGGLFGYAASAPGSHSGRGGRGAGALYIECAGALNYTGTIYAQGGNFVANGLGGSLSLGNNGGGGGGMVVILANIITANSGTTTVTIGTSGGANGGGGVGAVGANASPAHGIHGVLREGRGGGAAAPTTISTIIGITPSLSTLSSKFIPLFPGSGGGGAGQSNATAGTGIILSSGNGVAIVGLNTEFV